MARTTAGPAPPGAPATSARAPAAIAGGTSGTTIRLTAGATSERRPNSRSTMGVVAACAAKDTPRISAIQRRTRPGAGPASRSVSDEPQAMIPAVASTRQPESGVVDPGRVDRSRPATAQPSAAAAVPGRPSSRASSATPAITAGAHDGRRRPDERHVDDDRDGRSGPPGGDAAARPRRRRASRRRSRCSSPRSPRRGWRLPS